MPRSYWSKHSQTILWIGAAFGLLAGAIIILIVGVSVGENLGSYRAQSDGYAAQYPSETDKRLSECFNEENISIAKKCAQDAIEAGRDSQRSEYDLSAQRQMADWAFYLLLFTIAQSLLGIAGFAALIITIRQGREANEISANSARAQLRAYVIQDGWKWLHYQPTGIEQVNNWSVEVDWVNSGATPTRNLRLQLWYYYGKSDIPPDYHFDYLDAAPIPSLHIAPLGKRGSVKIHIPAADLKKVQEGQAFLYIWGWAKYKDVIPNSPEYCTKFCYQTIIEGDPSKITSDKNVVNFSSAVHHQHNCADEDCENC